MIMGRNKKQYIGAIEDESEAALIYDWHAVVTQGLKVSIQLNLIGGGVPDLIPNKNARHLISGQYRTLNQ